LTAVCVTIATGDIAAIGIACAERVHMVRKALVRRDRGFFIGGSRWREAWWHNSTAEPSGSAIAFDPVSAVRAPTGYEPLILRT
jgi:hypothetical protein